MTPFESQDVGSIWKMTLVRRRNVFILSELTAHETVTYSTACDTSSVHCLHENWEDRPFNHHLVKPVSSPVLLQLRRPAAPAPARDPPLLPPRPAKAAACPASFVTPSTRTASSESSASSAPRWRKTTATTPRRRLLRSSSGRAQVEVGLFVLFSVVLILIQVT